jgi:hypothetical protein
MTENRPTATKWKKFNYKNVTLKHGDNYRDKKIFKGAEKIG